MADSTRPNILLIILDTVRADHLPLYGYERDTMPLLEQFSRDAIVYERAISPSSFFSASFSNGKAGRPILLNTSI